MLASDESSAKVLVLYYYKAAYTYIANYESPTGNEWLIIHVKPVQLNSMEINLVTRQALASRA